VAIDLVDIICIKIVHARTVAHYVFTMHVHYSPCENEYMHFCL